MARRLLIPIALLAATLHGVGIARSSLPAQDGLKFLRVARQFHAEPWASVVRGSDQHPLYPALIALAQPGVAIVAGQDANSWKLAAQVVSTMASIAILLPIFAIGRRLFDESVGAMAALLFVLLPIPAEVGHDTLGDPLALLAFASSLAFGLAAMDTRRLALAIGCGVAAGVGYLARPEVAIVPMALVASAMIQLARRRRIRPTSLVTADPIQSVTSSGGMPMPSWAWALSGRHAHEGMGMPPRRRTQTTTAYRMMSATSFSLLLIVGAYTLVKGEVSEKLSIRTILSIPSPHDFPSRIARALPPGLDDPRWDFSAKEESAHPSRLSLPAATGRLLGRWSDVMGFGLVPLVIWGAWRSGTRRGMPLPAVGQASACRDGTAGRGLPYGEGGEVPTSRTNLLLVWTYAAIYAAILLRHAMASGYLSTRHTFPLAVVALPFAAATILAGVRSVRNWREARSPGSVERTKYLRVVAVGALLILAISAQMHHPPHPSRWGHNQAGRWLAENAREGEKVLDTRGWATFVSSRPGHDYWHVKQALMDPALAYVVVGEDERSAPSRRAETLRALLAYVAEPVASYPEREGGTGVGVRVYRFHRPDDWTGMRP